MAWDQKLSAYFRTDASGERIGPYCPQCRDGKNMAVRMAKESDGFFCTVCTHSLDLEESPAPLRFTPLNEDRYEE
jgi:hypothetical protein